MTVLFAVVAGLLVSLGPSSAAALADDPPVITESFESVSGLPAGWKFSEFTKGSTVTIASGAGADGTHFLRIVSSKPNHARVVVPVQITPNQNYQFHVMARASGATANMAAVLGMDAQYTVTKSVRTDQWQPLDLYVKAGPRTTVDITMGLGYFGQLNLGTADFDAVTMTQVSDIPNGATVAELTAPPAATADSTSTQGSHNALWVFVGILVVVVIGVAVFLMGRGGTEPDRASDHAD